MGQTSVLLSPFWESVDEHWIGGTLLAKRRSSAVIVTHLTPPFTKAELYGDMEKLHAKMYDYEAVEGDALKTEILRSITELVRANDLFKEIGYRENPPDDAEFLLPPERLEKLHEYLHSIEQADITEGLHVIGRSWTERQIENTATAMLGDTKSDVGLFDNYSKALKQSIADELDAQMRAFGGGYVKPSSGGDAIINPNAVPTGRNMGSIDIEQTPTVESYQIAQKLTDRIIEDYRTENGGEYPRRIACTLWGGESIRTRGVVLAQALYLMGLKPRRDSRGVVYEVEVIPSEELGRPRIDILVQTSGQFRDAAGSRIELLDRALILVAALPEEQYPNFVKLNTRETESTLKKQGHSAASARDYATARIFGSPTGNYGTGIMGSISRSEVEDAGHVADQYIRNMNGMYRSGKVWGVPVQGLLESQLKGTDLMLQSRSSNTWGPLSLDHVFEFNTLALAVREKTGKDPGIWFSDLRNGSRPRATTAVGAIREEARTTMWNPKFIRGLQKEGAKGAAELVEPVRNMQAWNYIQPDTIDETLWDETYRVYIEDKHELDMKAYFEEKSPYELQDLTSIMLETIRKGMWTPPEEVVRNLAELHVEMVEKHGAGCSADTCGNAKLHAFLGQHVPDVASYQAALSKVLEPPKTASDTQEIEGMRLEETKITLKSEKNRMVTAPFFISMMVLILACFMIGGFAGRQQRQNRNH